MMRPRRRRTENSKVVDTRPVRRFYIYRLIDAEGHLLYIGRSQDPLARLRSHLGWNGFTATMGIDGWQGKTVQIDAWGPYTYEQSLKFEREAIVKFQPPHNKLGKTRPYKLAV